MKLLFTGSRNCDPPTFMRLSLIAKELAFTDRPSIMFGDGDGDQWGTVGWPSPFRDFVKPLAEVNSPFLVSVHKPDFSFGPPRDFVRGCAAKDIDDPEFRRTFLEGFRDSDVFARKFLAPGNYGVGEPRTDSSGFVDDSHHIRAALLADEETLAAQLGPNREAREAGLFQVNSPEARRDTLRVVLTEVSLAITSALLACSEGQYLPVSDDPYIARLIALRTSDRGYVGAGTPAATLLALEVVKAVIPDEALRHLTLGDVIDYRKRAQEPYEAFELELTRFSTKLDGVPIADTEAAIRRVIAAEVVPALQKHRNDMKRIRDEMFGAIIKRISTWHLPTLSLAYYSPIPFFASVAACAATMLFPPIVDYLTARRTIARNNALAYIISAPPGVD